jgi:hypothetical protein
MWKKRLEVVVTHIHIQKASSGPIPPNVIIDTGITRGIVSSARRESNFPFATGHSLCQYIKRMELIRSSVSVSFDSSYKTAEVHELEWL